MPLTMLKKVAFICYPFAVLKEILSTIIAQSFDKKRAPSGNHNEAQLLPLKETLGRIESKQTPKPIIEPRPLNVKLENENYPYRNIDKHIINVNRTATKQPIPSGREVWRNDADVV
jgi:hypothetical protein